MLAGLTTFIAGTPLAGVWLGWFGCCFVGLLTTHLTHLARAAGTVHTAAPAQPRSVDPGFDVGQPPPPTGRGWRWDFEESDVDTAVGFPARQPG